MAGITEVRVSAYEVPTVAPESDGTAEWDRTTLILVELSAAGETGIGYRYADPAAGRIAATVLATHVRGKDPFDTRRIFDTCARAIRNQGREGLCAMAMSAVDVAAWDLKCKLLGQPLARVLGTVRTSIPAYGSGGFTSLSDRELEEQLGGWTDQGMRFVKMKVGREPARDHRRRILLAAFGLPRLPDCAWGMAFRVPISVQGQRGASHFTAAFPAAESIPPRPPQGSAEARGPFAP